ncbi:MAG: Uma2 family endonuclease [Caldilineaceae bacterium SB0665_bin_21]|nr:Uma2 family endonuclease [Caldilineaceae bacterium SB0665_bin_21]MYA04893.1 Uma2 family endonuclease [Caldilineaceae bacterium SB0664_bin_22]MYC63878.1 Uma2 family endonuclease [Caldilineaceae bacterium SB0661_bin_34]
MNTNPNTKVSVPARDNGLAASLKTGSATPLAPAAAPNGDRASSAWWDHIKSLDHYDSTYPYDPRHVYGPDFTDDDAYGKDGVHFLAGSAHGFAIDGSVGEARRLLGTYRVFKERCLKLPDLGMPKTNRYAQSGQVIPDIFIQERPRPDERRHEIAYDPDNPILFVLEVLSESTFRHDLEPKVEIYQAMGVREFWRYDPERVYRTGDEPLLWGLRLSPAGTYEDIESVRTADGLPVYRSDTLGEFRMLDEGGDIHTLQTWDAARGIWLDPMRAKDIAADEAKQVAVQETAAQTQMANLLSLLRQHVAQGTLAPDVPDTLAAAWQEAHWVPDFTEALRVASGERDWSTLLPPGDRGT